MRQLLHPVKESVLVNRVAVALGVVLTVAALVVILLPEHAASRVVIGVLSATGPSLGWWGWRNLEDIADGQRDRSEETSS